MRTEYSAKPMGFARVDGRAVVADFDRGAITSNAGGLLLGATDRAIGLVERFAACFADGRSAERVVHEVATLVGQRVFGIALGYEDLIDHDRLRRDPVLGVALGRLEARHGRCAPLAGKSTLNRIEHGVAAADRYRRIAHDGAAIEALFVDLFLDAHATPPKEIVLDLDATDDPLHGRQEGRFFHGYYDCHCYLPLYVFCGRHLLTAKLRRSNIDASAGAVEEVARIVAHIRARWPRVRIVLRADGGFARETLIAQVARRTASTTCSASRGHPVSSSGSTSNSPVPSMTPIGAIEKRREGAVACPHCGHDRSTRWGSTRTGVQRLRCRSCRRTFSSSTGTALARVHSPARFHQVVADMFCDHPRSCRRLGRALALDKMTIWRSPRVSNRWRPHGSPPEDHPRPRRFGRLQARRRGRSGREILPGIPQGLA